MKFMLLVLCLAATVFARPDVSHLSGGYHYKPPSTSYGVPIDNKHEGSGQHHHHHLQVPSGSYLPGDVQFQLPDVNTQQKFAGGNKVDYEGYNPQLIQDQKRVYYFSAPDQEPARLRIHLTPSVKKNTNVIFVKAPNYAPVIPEVIVPQVQAEEKTKVFVLVKKPEQPASISIQAPAPVKSKPEIYVVKYQDQHEAERVISGGRGGQPLGENVHSLGDEASFISSLQSDVRQHIPQNDKYSGFDGSLNFFGLRSGADKATGGSVGSFVANSGLNSGVANDFRSSGGVLEITGSPQVSSSLGSFGAKVEGGLVPPTVATQVVTVERGESGVFDGSSTTLVQPTVATQGKEFGSPFTVLLQSREPNTFGSSVSIVGSGSSPNSGSFEVIGGSKSSSDFIEPTFSSFTSGSSVTPVVSGSPVLSTTASSVDGSLFSKYEAPDKSCPY